MAVVFINGFNAKVGGGKSILNNFLSLLSSNHKKHKYYVLTPDLNAYIKFERPGVKIVKLPKILNNTVFFPFVYSFILDKLMHKYKAELVFNLADIPIKTSIKQVFLFDWSYAVYPESKVWKKMSFKEYFVRRTKLFYFQKYLKYIKILVAQTETMAERIHKLYNFENIKVVSNAVSLDNLTNTIYKDFNLHEGIKLLYLTYYYPHKNIESFLELAKRIKKDNLNYKLIVTLDSSQSNQAKSFLDRVQKEELNTIIINVGSVPMKYVPSLYRQCDALLMPTLLESFSGTYVEAMFHQKPIFTSNLDFAKGVCKDGAVYFDPEDIDDILDKIHEIFSDDKVKMELVLRGTKVLNELPDWPQVIEMFNEIIEEGLKKE